MTSRRWPPDPLRVLLATAVLFVIGAITLVALADPVVDLEEAELAAEAAAARARARAQQEPPPAPPPVVEVKPVDPPRARTKKGKILQERLEERRARLAAVTPTTRAAPGVSLRTGGADAALVARALKRKLTVPFVDDARADWALTLRVDRKAGPGVTLKCSVAVAAMPNKNLVASFSSQAGVEGEVSDDELLGDAAEACAGALAEDLGPWLRRAR